MNTLDHRRVERDRSVFLRTLLLSAEPDERRHFLRRMGQVEREERRSRRALKLCLVVAGACLLGWWAVATANPEAVEEARALVVDVFKGATAFSGFVLSLVMGCWLWNRSALNRTEREGIRLVLGLIESRTALPRS